MKMILAVIFWGILTFAFAAAPTRRHCNHPDAMKKFDSSKFLAGTWYVTNEQHGSDRTVCQDYKIETKSGIQELTADGFYNYNNQIAYYEVRCNKQSDNKGKLIFSCTQSGSSGQNVNIQFLLEVTVLSTDYDDIAVMFRCANYPTSLRGITGDILVLRRDPTKTDDKNSLIEGTLKKQKLPLNSLTSRKGVTCPLPPQK